jgi:hypothetical protein
MTSRIKNKLNEWLKRYIPAEILGTIIALTLAWVIYNQTHSYALAAAAGWAGEGIGFFGYFIAAELLIHAKRYAGYSFFKRIPLVIAAAGTNLIVEFLPAEIIDNLIIRPFAMFVIPHYIHPYPLGFLIGKLSADIFFYFFAAIGYEMRKRWLHRDNVRRRR